VADGYASADRNEYFWAARGNGARNRFAARGVPTLCVQSVGITTGSIAYARMMGHLADGAILARMIHEASAASADTRLRRAVSPFSPSTYCTSMPQGFTPPSARLASRLHAFATNLHESCGLVCYARAR
jgi:hypothetical protein